jgi:hypothetical protein
MDGRLFFEQIGRLVQSHNYDVAVHRYLDCKKELSPNDRLLGKALLRCSSGYTKAVIRGWLISGNLTLPEPQKSEFTLMPITSPLILYSGLELLTDAPPDCLRLLRDDCFKALVDSSKVTAVVFDELERHSKQQIIPGLPLNVREIAPAIVALLPDGYPHSPIGDVSQSLDKLRAKGRSILGRSKF